MSQPPICNFGMKLEFGETCPLHGLDFGACEEYQKEHNPKQDKNQQIASLHAGDGYTIIEHVCPNATKPVSGIIVGNGTMEKEVWEAADEGLSGKEILRWKTIKVRCDFCGEIHEYALTLYPWKA